MGYKFLGFIVWQGSKWYLRRRVGGNRAKIAAGGVGALMLAAGAAVASRQATKD